MTTGDLAQALNDMETMPAFVEWSQIEGYDPGDNIVVLNDEGEPIMAIRLLAK